MCFSITVVARLQLIIYLPIRDIQTRWKSGKKKSDAVSLGVVD